MSKRWTPAPPLLTIERQRDLFLQALMQNHFDDASQVIDSIILNISYTAEESWIAQEWRELIKAARTESISMVNPGPNLITLESERYSFVQALIQSHFDIASQVTESIISNQSYSYLANLYAQERGKLIRAAGNQLSRS